MKRILIVDDVKGWREHNASIVNEILGENIDIQFADCAQNAYNLILENNSNPFDIIITDLQRENNYEPKLAGEWLIEQIQLLNNYSDTQIIIISASYNVRYIAERFGVLCIPKSTALKCMSAYEEYLC